MPSYSLTTTTSRVVKLASHVSGASFDLQLGIQGFGICFPIRVLPMIEGLVVGCAIAVGEALSIVLLNIIDIKQKS